jgi:hypothetical protein
MGYFSGLTEEQTNEIMRFYEENVRRESELAARRAENIEEPETPQYTEPEDDEGLVFRLAGQIKEPEPQTPKLEAITAADLLQKKFERLAQAVQGLITEGLVLLVGASKIGKSWLVLSMCLRQRTGQNFLGTQPNAAKFCIWRWRTARGGSKAG